MAEMHEVILRAENVRKYFPITGLFGNILGTQILRLFRVNDRVAKGIALGCGSHAFGTVRALEVGEVEGAMSSLSLVITALLTVAAAPLLSRLI